MFFVIFVALTGTTLASVFHLTETPDGLLIPCRDDSQLLSMTGRCLLDSCHEIGSLPITAIQNISANENFELLGGYISMTPRSQFAEIYPTVMLLPSPEFHLITNIQDPTAYCLDGTIGTAQFAYPISFHVRVSLLPHDRSITSTALARTRESHSAFFDLSTVATKDLITASVYDALIDEMEALSGSRNFNEMDFETLIPQLPNLQYTVYYNDNSDQERDVIARVILQPTDYVKRSHDGSYELQLERESLSTVLTLGVNFLKTVAVSIDFENREIGFCEPM